jgi:hypothetical protein
MEGNEMRLLLIEDDPALSASLRADLELEN